jgi:16S rRNA C1402 (ribose-2'-O) methylase RsmI
VFSGQHRILLANELTKKYERRYNGTIGGLIEKLSNNDDFEPVGEVSYLVYPDNPAESSLPAIE